MRVFGRLERARLVGLHTGGTRRVSTAAHGQPERARRAGAVREANARSVLACHLASFRSVVALVSPQPPASGETKLALSNENMALALRSAGGTARAGQACH